MTYLDESTTLFPSIDGVGKQRVGAGQPEEPPLHQQPTLLRRLKSWPAVDESAAAKPSAEADRGAAKAAPGLMSRRAGGLNRAITLDLGAIREPAAKSAADS